MRRLIEPAAFLAASTSAEIVVGAGKPGDGVHQQKHILTGLDQTLGTLNGELGQTAMVAGLFVVGAGVDLRFGKCALELGDFLNKSDKEKLINNLKQLVYP